MTDSIPYLGESLALLTALIWAFAVILFKKSGEKLHPIALNLFKNALAFVLLIPTIWISGETLFRNVPLNDYILLFISGLLGLGIADTLFFKSLNLLGAGLSSIVTCLYSPFIITLSVIFLGEKLTTLQIVGIVIILSAILAATGSNGNQTISRRNLFLGIILAVIANAATAIGVVMIKPLLNRSPLLWATEIRLISGFLVAALVLYFHSGRSKIIRPQMNRRGWFYTIAGSFMGAYLAMILWLAGMKLSQASIAAALNQTSSIYIFLFAALLLKEPVNLRRIIGILMGVAGTMLVTFG